MLTIYVLNLWLLTRVFGHFLFIGVVDWESMSSCVASGVWRSVLYVVMKLTWKIANYLV